MVIEFAILLLLVLALSRHLSREVERSARQERFDRVWKGWDHGRIPPDQYP